MSEFDGAVIPELNMGMPAFHPSGETLSEADAIELNQEKTIAALAAHPGWELFTDRYRRQIMRLRTMAGVDLSNKSDAEVGQLKRAYDLAAERMEQELTFVESTAQVVNEDMQNEGQRS